MALKDWKELYKKEIRWRKEDSIVRVFFDCREKKYKIEILNKIRGKFEVTFKKRFKTQKQAIAFAKDYMRGW